MFSSGKVLENNKKIKNKRRKTAYSK